MSTDVIHAYLDVWNERDADARLGLMKAVLVEDSLYIDPDHAGLRGHAELSEAISRTHQMVGDVQFSIDEVIGVHHDRALFTWRLGSVARGYDAVEFDGGRIRSIVGFFVRAERARNDGPQST